MMKNEVLIPELMTIHNVIQREKQVDKWECSLQDVKVLLLAENVRENGFCFTSEDISKCVRAKKRKLYFKLAKKARVSARGSNAEISNQLFEKLKLSTEKIANEIPKDSKYTRRATMIADTIHGLHKHKMLRSTRPLSCEETKYSHRSLSCEETTDSEEESTDEFDMYKIMSTSFDGSPWDLAQMNNIKQYVTVKHNSQKIIKEVVYLHPGDFFSLTFLIQQRSFSKILPKRYYLWTDKATSFPLDQFEWQVSTRSLGKRDRSVLKTHRIIARESAQLGKYSFLVCEEDKSCPFLYTKASSIETAVVRRWIDVNIILPDQKIPWHHNLTVHDKVFRWFDFSGVKEQGQMFLPRTACHEDRGTNCSHTQL